MVSVTGVIINLIMLVFIIILVIFGVSYQKALSICENNQSSFCYSIQCPCDATNPQIQGNAPPCFGYAKRPGKNPGQWYCSNAPTQLVDNDGSQI